MTNEIQMNKPKITYSQSATQVHCFDFVEVMIRVASPVAANPFTDITVSGEFTRDGGAPLRADGFCDAEDGSMFRIRFMPTQPGRHAYSVEIQGQGLDGRHTGSFAAR